MSSVEAGEIQLAADTADIALTFRLNEDLFAIDVSSVQEVVDPLPVSIVPNADPFSSGVINARGSVVPVVDLKFLLGVSEAERTSETRFIVMQGRLRHALVKLAIVADAVLEVVEFGDVSVRNPPDFGLRWPTAYVRGIINYESKVLTYLDTEALFRPPTT